MTLLQLPDPAVVDRFFRASDFVTYSVIAVLVWLARSKLEDMKDSLKQIKSDEEFLSLVDGKYISRREDTLEKTNHSRWEQQVIKMQDDRMDRIDEHLERIDQEIIRLRERQHQLAQDLMRKLDNGSRDK